MPVICRFKEFGRSQRIYANNRKTDTASSLQSVASTLPQKRTRKMKVQFGDDVEMTRTKKKDDENNDLV